MDRAIVPGQSGGREDLQTETEVSDEFISHTDNDRRLKIPTVFSSAGFWVRVNPSRILPRYNASLLFSVNKKKSRNYLFSSVS